MKTFSFLLAVSFLANVTLLWQRPGATPVASPAVALPAQTQLPTVAPAPRARWEARPAVQPSATAPAPSATTNTSAFHWSQLPVDDLRQLILRLRAGGCPEETLLDIAEMNLDAARGQRWRAREARHQFWQSPPQHEWVIHRREEKVFRDQDMALMNELFGEATMQQRKEKELAESGENDYAFLSSEKRSAIYKLMTAHEEESAERQVRNHGLRDAQNRAEDAAAQEALEKRLAQVLTPAELQRWRLQSSQTANQLQSDLEGLKVSEAEYQSLFAIRDRYGDRVNNYASGDDEASVKANAAAEALRKQMQAEIVAALGETRAKEVERNDDYEFQQLRRLATRSELPADTAMKVYDLKEATEASTEKFEQNDQLTDEQRAAARKAIYAEAEKATQTLLGETAFKKYLSNPGVWLRNHN